MEFGKMTSLAVLVAGALSASASAQSIVDGDTFRLNGTVYRLWGIDAPETAQVCLDGWKAGIEATNALRNILGNQVVVCEPRDTDRFKRTVAVCRAEGKDIGAAMVTPEWLTPSQSSVPIT